MSSCTLWAVGAVCALAAIAIAVICSKLPDNSYKTIATLHTLGIVLGLLTFLVWAGALVLALLPQVKP